MYSIEDVNGEKVWFEDEDELELDTVNDYITDEITAYLICGHEVSEEIYKATKEKMKKRG